MATTGSGEKAAEERVSVEMPAPDGWTKKFIPQSRGISEFIFVSPTGEEIKNKRQLNKYLKANPGSPASSEFDWSTGDTLVQSTRIGEKVKVFDSPEGEKIPKRSRNSSGRNGKKKEDTETEEGKDAETGKEAPKVEEDKEAEAGKKALSEDAAKSTNVETKPAEEPNIAVESTDVEMKPAEVSKAAPRSYTAESELPPAPVEDKEDAKPAEAFVNPTSGRNGKKKEDTETDSAMLSVNPTSGRNGKKKEDTETDSAMLSENEGTSSGSPRNRWNKISALDYMKQQGSTISELLDYSRSMADKSVEESALTVFAILDTYEQRKGLFEELLKNWVV